MYAAFSTLAAFLTSEQCIAQRLWPLIFGVVHLGTYHYFDKNYSCVPSPWAAATHLSTACTLIWTSTLAGISHASLHECFDKYFAVHVMVVLPDNLHFHLKVPIIILTKTTGVQCPLTANHHPFIAFVCTPSRRE